MGVVIWITWRGRPDIAFASHFLSRCVGAPTTTHITAAIHLLRYLLSTHSHGLLFRVAQGDEHEPPAERELVIYHDATFAGDPHDSSSVAAFVAFVNGTLVHHARAHPRRHHKTDNSGLEHLANNVNDGELPGQRHIRTRIHHLKEAIRSGRIRVKWVPADVMHADILTKCVGVPRFESMREHQVTPAPPK